MRPDSPGMKKVYNRVEGIIGKEDLVNNGCRMRKDREDHEDNDRARMIKGKGDLVGKKDNRSLVRIESQDHRNHRDHRGKMLKNDSNKDRQDRNRNKEDSSRNSKDEPRENNTKNLTINNWLFCRMKPMWS